MRQPTPVTPEIPLQSMLRDYWDEVSSVATAIDLDSLEQAALMLLACQARGRVVFVVGNGGSAATASHFACDLSKGTRRDGPPTFHVVSLTDNVPLLTAWANDIGYDRVFSEQLQPLARPGDVLVVISASGNSPNVIAAIETARSCGMSVIGLTGRSGGHLASLVDVLMHVPSDRIEVVEDAHLIAAHSLCVAVRERLTTCEPAVPTTELSVVRGRRAGR